MSLHVVDPGLYTLVVDRGRPSSRGLGVPVGGAADRRSLALGNALVGNEPDAAALEMTLAGPTVRADCSLACVIYGAPFAVKGDQHRGPAWVHAGTTFTLAAGEVLTVGGTPEGMRAYLCVQGGFQSKPVLGSRSSLEPVRAGDALGCETATIRPRFLPYSPRNDESVEAIRVVAGPQAEWFHTEALYGGEFEVTPASNRMGLRLWGEPLAFRGGQPREMVSEPVAPGAVQVTRDGQCIILGVDGQTIGGYPKVAHVIAADLDRLGQLRPGRRLRLVTVSLDEAAALYRRQQMELGQWLTRLRTTLGR